MRVIRILLACSGLSLAASCSLRQPAVSTVDYVFDIPAAVRSPAGAKSISVAPFTAGPKAAGQMLLYRVGDTRYEHDFYNRLLAPPPQLLTGALRRHLSQARAGQVREPGTPLGSDLLVQPRLVELYADYRDELRPAATVAVVVVLIERGTGGSREVFERTYRRSVPMKAVSPAAAVDGWSEGLGQIFRDFTADLRRAAG
jgi:ABC-type transport auxiliary lipoprotein component